MKEGSSAASVWRTLVETRTRVLLLILATAGLAAIVYRFAFGLGAATNLSDRFPWGLWIGLDVLVGIALAAGGFTLALTVYILNLERYRPLLRPALLTAFIGYVLSASAILFDIGQPQRIWHPLVYWNIHSPLLEVALCVMAYLAVLALELSPAFFERLGWRGALKTLKLITIPLVVAGVVLSTMHQSSLGALFLIVPGRMHPLYYSQLLPWLFFVSAAAVGLAVVSLEAYIGHKTMKLHLDPNLIASLAKGTWWILLGYGVLRFGDLAVTGKLGYLFEGSVESNVFLAETFVGLVVPMVLLALPAVRRNLNWLAVAQGFAVLGVVLNRLDILLVSMTRSLGGSYIPSLVEVILTVGMIAAGALTYIVASVWLPIHGAQSAAAGGERVSA